MTGKRKEPEIQSGIFQKNVLISSTKSFGYLYHWRVLHSFFFTLLAFLMKGRFREGKKLQSVREIIRFVKIFPVPC